MKPTMYGETIGSFVIEIGGLMTIWGGLMKACVDDLGSILLYMFEHSSEFSFVSTIEV